LDAVRYTIRTLKLDNISTFSSERLKSSLAIRFRVSVASEGCGSDVLRDPGGVSGRSAWTNNHGRLPDLLPALACHLSPR
jgi:hypothetical protein